MINILIIIACVIYYFLGFATVYFLSIRGKLEGSAWILVWGFGPFIWPVLLTYYTYKEINRDLDRYEDFGCY